jgi:cell division protein FtsZ
MALTFEIMEDLAQKAVIKVIGVGGCGGNAVNHMINSGVHGVEFICANTDVQALNTCTATKQLQIGSALTRGLGAGADPEVGREAALEDEARIAEAMNGADMLFITAGMGGGTGTGAAPVVARIAREKGILTVAVVTKPFAFEGKRQKAAQTGIDELSKYVDSLIVIPNDKLLQVLGEDITFQEAFKAADDILRGAVAGIAEIINCEGLVNVDFADVKAVMSEMGMAMMGSAAAEGELRAREAAEQAVASPLLEDITLSGARGILVNISCDHSMKMREVHEVMETVKAYASEDAKIIFGTVFDQSLNGKFRVTLVATGLDAKETKPQLSVINNVALKTGTDNLPVDFEALSSTPAVWRGGRRGSTQSTETSHTSSAAVFDTEEMDIPAFLRRQAD